jgi:hypothetical protein
MKNLRTLAGSLGALLMLAAVLAGSASAATTLRFEELQKGSTFAFVDNAPTSELHHGFPSVISAGDSIVITHPIAEGGKTVGKLSTSCTATKTSKVFDKAGFMCQGTFALPGGTLVASAMIASSKGTEGAILGGTGKYAGARGTFVSKEGKGRSTVTVTLAE